VSLHISRTQIKNFRNFADMDVLLQPTSVLLGENKASKSNFLFALRLVLDNTLPDSSRFCARRIFMTVYQIPSERPSKSQLNSLVSMPISGRKPFSKNTSSLPTLPSLGSRTSFAPGRLCKERNPRACSIMKPFSSAGSSRFLSIFSSATMFNS